MKRRLIFAVAIVALLTLALLGFALRVVRSPTT
jgi:hypothetical protein